jgi:hypothetical protein
MSNFCTGTLISDVSDHFISFICNGKNIVQGQQRTVSMRIFSATNILKFKEALANSTWLPTLSENSTDNAYDAFWAQYKSLFDLSFPLTKLKFNKNVHKINNFMSAGLLISRGTKNNLHKQSLANPTPLTINLYKQFRNIYAKTLRAAKILHIQSKLRACKGNSKKTWQILNECTGRTVKNENVEKIISNGSVTEDPLEIANEFNNFFVKVGQDISDSVPTIDRSPESYLVPPVISTPFNMQNVTPEYLVKIVKDLKSKNSNDIDGVSSKMIKLVIQEIKIPLSHIFNLSLLSGDFPLKLKRSKVVPIFESGNKMIATTIDPFLYCAQYQKFWKKLSQKNFWITFSQTISFTITNMVFCLKDPLSRIYYKSLTTFLML